MTGFMSNGSKAILFISLLFHSTTCLQNGCADADDASGMGKTGDVISIHTEPTLRLFWMKPS
jgi:hypothetical protein